MILNTKPLEDLIDTLNYEMPELSQPEADEDSLRVTMLGISFDDWKTLISNNPVLDNRSIIFPDRVETKYKSMIGNMEVNLLVTASRNLVSTEITMLVESVNLAINGNFVTLPSIPMAQSLSTKQY